MICPSDTPWSTCQNHRAQHGQLLCSVYRVQVWTAEPIPCTRMEHVSLSQSHFTCLFHDHTQCSCIGGPVRLVQSHFTCHSHERSSCLFLILVHPTYTSIRGVDRRIYWRFSPRVLRGADQFKVCTDTQSRFAAHFHQRMVADSGSHAPGCHFDHTLWKHPVQSARSRESNHRLLG